MKFSKLFLDESLFDSTSMKYDDDFSETELPPESLQGPTSGSDSGVTDLVITAINDEWEAIRTYNSIIETLKYEAPNNDDYVRFIQILNDINAEENKHVGQLQEILQRLSPNAKFIDKGRDEGRSQFNFANGLLQVQAWEPKQTTATVTPDVSGEDAGTLTDIDDDM